MAAVVSVHSSRCGTGKKNTTADVAALLAASGKRVGVIDADIQSPCIHVPFGIAVALATGSVQRFAGRLNEIIRGLRADGRLKPLSMTWFGKDYASEAQQFDINAIGQEVR